MFQTNFVKKVKTQPFSERRAVYEIMWKNMVEPYGPQLTI